MHDSKLVVDKDFPLETIAAGCTIIAVNGVNHNGEHTRYLGHFPPILSPDMIGNQLPRQPLNCGVAALFIAHEWQPPEDDGYWTQAEPAQAQLLRESIALSFGPAIAIRTENSPKYVFTIVVAPPDSNAQHPIQVIPQQLQFSGV